MLDNKDLTPLNPEYCIMVDRRRRIYYIHKMASTLSGELGEGTLLRIRKK